MTYAQWVSLPLVTANSRAAGNSGGEGCQVLEALTCDSTGSVLLASTDVGGLLRSLDSGTTWTPINVTYSARGATAVGIDPKQSTRFLVAGSSGGPYQSANGLYLSTNQGETWSCVLSNTNAVTKQFRDQIAYDPVSYSSSLGYTQRIYWSSPTTSGSLPGALYKSENGGTSWSVVATTILSGSATGVGNSILKVDPNGVLYAANSTGIYRSNDNGSSFSLVVGGNIKGMDLVDASKIYYNDSVSVSIFDVVSGTSSKLAASGLPTGKLTDIRVSPVDQTRMAIFAGDFNPICYSLDGGATWARSNCHNSQSFIPDNSNQNGHAAAWHPTLANTIYGFSWGFLIKSADGGANYYWSNNGYTGVDHSGYFNFNVTDPNLLLVTSQDYNSALTTDAGYTWKYLNVANTGWGGYNYGGYAISSGSGGRLFAGNAPSWGGTRYLTVSIDGGNTWKNLNLTGNSSDAACGDPADSNYAYWDQWRTTNGMLTGTTSDWMQMTNCTGVHTYNPVGKELYGKNGASLVRSVDHGATWVTLCTLPNTINDLAYDQVRNRIYAVTSLRKLFQVDLNPNPPVQIDITGRLPKDQNNAQGANTVAVDPVNPAVVYIGEHTDTYMTSVAIARSIDAGVNWTSLTKKAGDTGLDGGHEVQCVRVNPNSRYLYVGGECFGTWAYAPSAFASAVYEAENLSVVDQYNAVSATGSSTGCSNGFWRSFGTQSVGAYATLAVPNCKATTYKLSYVVRRYGNPGGPGVFQLSYSENPNGPFTNLGSTVNFYDVNYGLMTVNPGNVTFSTPGTKYLRWTSTGLSGGQNYDGKIDVVTLTDLSSYEVESMSVASSSGAPEQYLTDSNLSGGAGTLLSGSASGDYVTYNVPNLAQGTYGVKLGFRSSPSSGIFQVSINGANVGSAVDAYTSGTSYPVTSLGNCYVSTTGTQNIGFRLTGKNANSSGYAMCLDYVQFVFISGSRLDSNPPAITTPGNLTAEATGANGAVVNFVVTGTDDVDGTVPVTCSPASGSVFPLGTSTVNCSATDSSGNTSAASFTVTVRDTTAPSLNLPGSITAEATSASGATVNYSVSASDLVSGNVAVNATPASGSVFPIGTTTVNCSATDAAGNTSSGSFTVTVADTTAPVLSLPANITQDTTSPNGAVVNFTATASDAVNGAVPVTCSPASGSTFPVGTTTVNCSATDSAGNTSTGSFTVTVRQISTRGVLADAYVRDGTYAATNYGSATVLCVKTDSSSYTRWTYVKIDLSSLSGTITSGKLSLALSGTSGSASTPVAIYPCASTSWVENTLTWNNKPAASGGSLTSVTIPGTSADGTWYTWDVTSYLQQQKNAGNTTATLILEGTTAGSNNWVNFYSREGGGSSLSPVVSLISQ